MAGMREKSPEGLSGQPRFLSGAERGARQEARRVAWILRHTSGLPPACIWWQGRSIGRALFSGGMLLSSMLSPAGCGGWPPHPARSTRVAGGAWGLPFVS